MRAWYCPSWNGDLRLEPDPKRPEWTMLSIVKPTANELVQLKSLAKVLEDKNWIGGSSGAAKVHELMSVKAFRWGTKKFAIHAPIEDVGPVATSIFKPGPAVLTAVRFANGQVEVCETSQDVTPKGKPYRDPALPPKSEPAPAPPKSEPTEEVKALAKKKDAEAAATVKRPTPCCPDCYEDAIGPATEVLLSFLTPEQHEDWRRHRFVKARGGLSGHVYVIAHRHSAFARENRRLCYDLTSGGTMHFHDWSVPPEEEVLASMLILQHREPWLRNEATVLGHGSRTEYVFKNPFGDGSDGMPDSAFTAGFGAGFARGLQQ